VAERRRARVERLPLGDYHFAGLIAHVMARDAPLERIGSRARMRDRDGFHLAVIRSRYWLSAVRGTAFF
jgi:hypothetical protein